MTKPWIGVDLDGTLAHYIGWEGYHTIGNPIADMVTRVQQWLREGKTVKIFTARVWCPRQVRPHGSATRPEMEQLLVSWNKIDESTRPSPQHQEFRAWLHAELSYFVIRKWCKEHIGVELEITNVKDPGMLELWDDRAVQVEINTGRKLNVLTQKEADNVLKQLQEIRDKAEKIAL